MASGGDVIAFLGVAVKTVQYFQGIRRAPKERGALLDQISNLVSVLADLKTINPLMTMDLSKEDQDRARSLIDQLDPDLHKIHQDLLRKPKRAEEFWTRIRWPSAKAEVREKLTDLENAVHNIRRYQEMATAKRLAWNRVRQWILPSIARDVRTTPYISSVTPGTGEGLLRSKEFKDWRATDNGVLWCNGPQGSGKTGQIKVVQQHLEELMDGSGHQVAVVYCNEQILRSLKDPMDVVMSFWAQLDAMNGTSELKLPKETLNELLSMHKTDGLSMLSMEKAARLKMDILCHHIEKSRTTILILDGLDEVPINSLSSFQQDIVDRLMEVQRRTNKCHLLFASRPYDSIRRIFYPPSCPSQSRTVLNYQVQVGELDLKRYVEEQINKHEWPLKYSEKIEDAVQRVIDTLVPKCRGEESFLLARLYMHEVLRVSSLRELNFTMKNLPTSAADVYKQGLVRLSKECAEAPNGLPCKAIQALYWVTWAKRPLKSEELEQILAIGEGQNDIDFNSPGLISLEPSIESVCGELVVVDSSSGRVSVEHKTLTEYLERPDTLKMWWGDRSPAEYMASILLTYLSLRCLKEQLDADSSRFQTQQPLLDYALRYWGNYLTGLEENSAFWERVYRFLTGPSQEWNEQTNERALAVVASEHLEQAKSNDVFATGTLSPLHWAVNFDFENLIKSLFEHEENSPPERPVPISPLGLSISHRSEITRRLLDCGANANDYEPKNRYRRPPLYDAVACAYLKPVEVLLQAGAQWTVKREDNDNSAVHHLYYRLNTIHLANMALETMSAEELKSEGLQLLVKGRFTARLRRAIHEGLDVNQPCDNGKRALDYAYELGDAEMIDLLKRHGATTRLSWPAFKPESSSIPQNFPDVQPTGSVIIKEATEFPRHTTRQFGSPWKTNEETVLLDVVIGADFKLPVRCLVFETISCDQAWSNHEGQGTYLGSGDGCSFFVRVRNQQELSIFDVQHNVHASDTWRLHTNVWNLSDLDRSFPARAQCMRDMQSGTSLQVVSRTRTDGWVNKVKFARIRVYGEEVNL